MTNKYYKADIDIFLNDYIKATKDCYSYNNKNLKLNGFKKSKFHILKNIKYAYCKYNKKVACYVLAQPQIKNGKQITCYDFIEVKTFKKVYPLWVV